MIPPTVQKHPLLQYISDVTSRDPRVVAECLVCNPMAFYSLDTYCCCFPMEVLFSFPLGVRIIDFIMFFGLILVLFVVFH